jgi:hypothetical protein
MANISEKEKTVLKERAKLYFAMSEVSLQKAIKAKIFVELRGASDEQNIKRKSTRGKRVI